MAFQLSPQADPNKVFLVNLSETEGRLDPIMQLYKRKTNNFNFQAFAIKNLLIKPPQYGANEAGIERNNKSQPRYIRITDIEDDGTLSNDLGKTAEKIENKYFLSNNDVLFARSGNTVGKAYIHKTSQVDCDCFFAGYMIRFCFNENLILSDYAFVITQLPFYKDWVNAVQRMAGQPNINAEEYKNAKIPVPDFVTQKEIIKIYDNAYTAKRTAEAEARQLLNGIDTYILNELGIPLPEADNSLENRVFYANFSEVSGGRLDPKLYDNNTKALFRAVAKGKYRKVSLRSLITHSVAGSWGFDEILPLPEEEYTKTLCIRATEFDNLFNLNLDGSRVKYRQIGNTKLKSMDIKPNDLLIEKSGGSPDQPVGRVSILTDEILEEHTVSFSNFIHKIRIDPSVCLPEYLFCYLKTMHNIKVTEAMQSQTNGIRNLIMREYFGQTILLPDLDKQKEIAATAQAMRQKAQDLMQQGKAQLEATKKEVERMILNSDAPSV